jgi:hypothetical protein
MGVIGVGNTRKTSIKSTESDAIKTARHIAKNQKTELVIHNKNGRISDKGSYGNDPHPPEDMKH